MLHVTLTAAPRDGCMDEERESFREEWGDITASIAEEEIILVGADMNGHVGETGDGYEDVRGAYGYD